MRKGGGGEKKFRSQKGKKIKAGTTRGNREKGEERKWREERERVSVAEERSRKYKVCTGMNRCGKWKGAGRCG